MPPPSAVPPTRVTRAGSTSSAEVPVPTDTTRKRCGASRPSSWRAPSAHASNSPTSHGRLREPLGEARRAAAGEAEPARRQVAQPLRDRVERLGGQRGRGGAAARVAQRELHERGADVRARGDAAVC